MYTNDNVKRIFIKDFTKMNDETVDQSINQNIPNNITDELTTDTTRNEKKIIINEKAENRGVKLFFLNYTF